MKDNRDLDKPQAPESIIAKFAIGLIVRHKHYSFRGVVFNVDAQFSGDAQWLASIEESIRPSPDQPFYHLVAENGPIDYIAYVSEQNLIEDSGAEPLRMLENMHLFEKKEGGHYRLRYRFLN